MPRFVDTNILVYAEDLDAGRKHALARDLVVDLWQTGDGVVSIQVLKEYFVTVTRKLARPMSVPGALRAVEQYLTWTTVANTGPMLLDAIRLAAKARLSFWDAMVVQAALSAGCNQLLSEDLSPGQQFGDLTVVNPLV